MNTFIRTTVLALLCLILASALGQAEPLRLVISQQDVTIDGQVASRIVLNGQLPGPVLRFRQGEMAEISVTNQLDVPSSIHWHGLILPGEMDGVPGLNGFAGIPPGETFTYRFPLRQSGTYWYHAHSRLQEQDGLYGALVITPRDGEAATDIADRDYVLLLSEFHPERAETILHKLKSLPGYYNQGRRTLADLFRQAARDGWGPALADRKAWGGMRMDPTDLTDVTGYTFLINGRSPQANWTGLFTPGERVRLRVINASAMSFFDFRIPGLMLDVVAADGRDVRAVTVDEFRIGPAETYDVIVTPGQAPAYRVVAEPIDRSGFASGTLAVRDGLRGPPTQQRSRAELTLTDMGMNHGGHDMSGMADMNHDMAMDHDMDHAMPASPTGWADAGTPPGLRALRYEDLISLQPQPDQRAPVRDLTIRLTGNMERYSWTLNGQHEHKTEPLRLNDGERVRLRFVNETMMAHPMHLHGMFVQLENGQPPASQPDKHTLIVPPGRSLTALLTADQAGEWALHCHLLYHMASGMMGKIVVARGDAPAPLPGGIPVAHGHNPLAWAGRVELDHTLGSDDIIRWDSRLWFGDDRNRLLLRSEGERQQQRTDSAQIWALGSRNISTFWDVQAGLRADTAAASRQYAVLGIEGLAPYFFDTELHALLSRDGVVSLRAHQSVDIQITQQLILQPRLALNAGLRQEPDDGQPDRQGRGLRSSEAGLRLRHEWRRDVVPYLDWMSERAYGDTADWRRADGESTSHRYWRIGLMLRF